MVIVKLVNLPPPAKVKSPEVGLSRFRGEAKSERAIAAMTKSIATYIFTKKDFSPWLIFLL
jgi:hypothetical protein